MADRYAELAAEFLAGNKTVEAELKRIEKAQADAEALRRRQEAAERFEAEQKLAAEMARADEERRAEAERVAALRADLGVAQHELDLMLTPVVEQAARVMELSVAAFNDGGHETVAAQIRGAIFAGLEDPFRRRLLAELGGDWATARKMAEALGA